MSAGHLQVRAMALGLWLRQDDAAELWFAAKHGMDSESLTREVRARGEPLGDPRTKAVASLALEKDPGDPRCVLTEGACPS